MYPRHALTSPFVLLLVLCALVVTALTAAPAGAIVGGTDQVSDEFTAPLAYVEISEPRGDGACTGTLISPTVVMTAAHCVYETNKRGNLLGIARPSAFRMRVGSRDPRTRRSASAPTWWRCCRSRTTAGTGSTTSTTSRCWRSAGRWSQTPAVLAEQHPGEGKPLLIAGYGRSSTTDKSGPRRLRVAQIDAADPGLLPSRLGELRRLLAVLRHGRVQRSHGAGRDGLLRGFGRPGVRLREHHGQRRGRGRHQLRRGFRLRGLALVPHARGQRARIHRSRAGDGSATVERVARRPAERDRQGRQPQGRPHRTSSRCESTTTEAVARASPSSSTPETASRLRRPIRSVPTNRWVRLELARRSRRSSGSFCVQGTDGTKKQSNTACARDVVR